MEIEKLRKLLGEALRILEELEEMDRPKDRPEEPCGMWSAEDLASLYHGTFPELPRCQAIGKSLTKTIRARLKEHPEESWWVDYFAQVRNSDFLMGHKTNWTANLPWLVGPKNMDKVLSGAYQNIPEKVLIPIGKTARVTAGALTSWLED